MLQRGLFIVVEGCDRSGKSTQCANLVSNLTKSGIDAELIKFPDRTTQTGKMIDNYLQQKSELDDHAIHLLFSANRWEAMQAIHDKIVHQRKTLVVDRYAFSGVAFSSAKGLDSNWCRHSDVGLLSPDIVLFLDLPIDEAEKRGGFGEERYEKKELQIRVREEFMKLEDKNWKFIDATQSKEEIEQNIWTIIQDLFKDFQITNNKPLEYNLWK